ncbi:hypothetical protein GCM10023116_26690 [Kistimonas scapharcae]|uniref:Uncharacterized protein n=1 Tax=Kistimonas scapharcae TaxID=1036133 RepID=A0ABP8V3L3_9GAMM
MPLLAVKQETQLFFQLAQRHTGRRLGDMQALCGGSNISVKRYSPEDFKLT